SAEHGARQMFTSVKEFKKLPDYLQVWPGHGAGSACGRNLGAVPSTTLGYEKLFSWAFNIDNEIAFVKELLREQPEPPYYFSEMKRINKEGPPLLSTVPTPERLPSTRLESILAEGYPVIDTRTAGGFAASHIPGTLNIPHDSSFTQWAGWLIGFDIPYYLIVDPPMLDQLHRALSSIGLDHCGGCFEISAIQAWASSGHELECYSSAFPSQLVDQILGGAICLVDVRNLNEWNEGHIPGARHIMLGTLKARLNELPNNKPIVLQCRTGVRSAIGASILQANGFSNVINLMGGIREWEAAGYAAS
ncbi:MAG: rhodanese-like domain-containing protein, partial [Candidatus Promineifilaceae bacterium]